MRDAPVTVEDLTKYLASERKKARAEAERYADKRIAELRKPDRTIVEELGIGNSEPRITAGSPAWEREYDLKRKSWDEETQAARTPENDLETQQWLRAVVTNDQAMLREISDRSHNQTHARADILEGGTGAGLVPTALNEAVELIRVRAARLRPFCNVIMGGVEINRKVPVQTTKTVAAKFAEAADMTSGVTEPVYGSVTPAPVKIGALVEFSRELLDDSPLQLASLVTQDIGEAIATQEDLFVLDGANFSDSLFADVGTGSATWTDASETLATLTTKYYELSSVFRGMATWVINEATAAILTAITATDGRPMLQEFDAAPRTIDDVDGQVGTLLGRPVLVFPTGATGVPANEGFFGDLSGYTVYIREELRSEMSTDVSFKTDMVTVKISRRMDGILSQSGRMLRFA